MPSLSGNWSSFDFWMSGKLDLQVVVSYPAGVRINAWWLSIARKSSCSIAGLERVLFLGITSGLRFAPLT
jgi:hypothetical protein